MCPPGYHVVHGHERICKSGATTWVDTHIRANRGKIYPGLLKENLLYLYWNSKKKFPVLAPIYGFKGSDEFDEVIQFWLGYWKEQGVPLPDDLDPLIIKTLIAVESTFDPLAKSRVKGSSAAGLMQITDQSLRVLGGYPNKKKWIEAKTNLIHVENADKVDPVVSIALGIRLLGHKFSQIPNGPKKNLREAIRSYHSRDKAGDEYAKKILELYEKSRKK